MINAVENDYVNFKQEFFCFLQISSTILQF